MATRHYTASATPDATKRYASDLDDQEFALIAPHLAQKEGSSKKRTVDIREVLNAIFYRCQERWSVAYAAERFPCLVSCLVLLPEMAQ
jgi:hypothetical protein